MRRALIALVLVAAALLGARHYLLHHLEAHLIKVHGPGSRTPAARGLPYEAIPIRSGDRTLRSFYVPADGPALLVFHGNGEAISSWVEALKILHDGGIAAMVFDYSGFGASSGEPTLAHFREDGIAAWQVFRTRLPAGSRACAYGLSLGSGVLLKVAAELQPPADCLVVSGAFLSIREAAVRSGNVPRWASLLVPDVLDNLANAARARGPLLIEHGASDGLFPVEWATRLAAAHPGAQLAIVPGMKHADPVAHPTQASWDPVIRFVKSSAATAAH